MALIESKLDLSETFSDLPPESFWVPSDGEQDWFNRNAVMQRKRSLKLGYNRNFNSFDHRTDVHSSRKLSKPSVFGLPNLQKSGGANRNPPEKKSGTLLFRSRSEPGGKPIAHASDPGSPRVSCTGRVGLKNGDGKKTGISRLLSSFFGAGARKNQSRIR